jgi:hypothetical protein
MAKKPVVVHEVGAVVSWGYGVSKGEGIHYWVGVTKPDGTENVVYIDEKAWKAIEAVRNSGKVAKLTFSITG